MPQRSNRPTIAAYLCAAVAALYLIPVHLDNGRLQAQSALALVQHAGQDAGTASSATLAFPMTNGVGNWIGVFIRASETGQNFSVRDTQGNLYQRAIQLNETIDRNTVAVYYAENIVGGNNAVTVTNSISGATLRIATVEYSGLATTSSLISAAASHGTGSTPSSGSVTKSSSKDLVLALTSTANPRTIANGPGFVGVEAVPSTSGAKLAVQEGLNLPSGSVTATSSLSEPDVWSALAVAVRAGEGTVPPPAAPVITAVSPSSASTGTLVMVTGSDFGSTQGSSSIGLGTVLLTPSAWNASTIAFTIPAAASSGDLVVTVGGRASNRWPFTIVAPPPSGDTEAPSAPGALSATVMPPDRVSLAWGTAADNSGIASYTVEQCAGAGCGNFAPIASVSAGTIRAPLRPSSNPNYFMDADGVAIALNGSHTWNSLQDWGANGVLEPFDFDAFVSFLVRHGQNFTFLWRTELPTFCGLPTTSGTPPEITVAPHPWLRTGPGIATDGRPKFDLTKFDPAFFDRLRERTEALNRSSIYAGVYLFSSEWLRRFRCADDGEPFTGSNNINGINGGTSADSITMTAPNAITALQDAFIEKMIDTLNDLPNVMWIVSEEAPIEAEWWNAHLIAKTRAYEAGKPFQHPIGYGADIYLRDSVLMDSDADWIAPGAFTAPTTSCGNGTPRCKVAINDSDHSYYGLWNVSAQSNRNWLWSNFMSGNQAAFMDPYVVFYPRESRNLCPGPVNSICAGPDPRYDNFRDNFGYIVDYSRRLNLANIRPRPDLCSTANCLAQVPAVGAEYLVYSLDGSAFTVDLSKTPSSRTLVVEWFNPATGAKTPGGTVPGGSASRTFTPPFSGDAVLYLVDAAGHAGPAPHAPATSYTVGSLPSGTYRFRVRAVDIHGNAGPYTNIADATLGQTDPDPAPDTQPPTAPGSLTTTSVTANQIDLGWTASTDNTGVASYQISRCQGSGCGVFTSIGTSATTMYQDTGLTAATPYSYRVTAKDPAGNVSAPSTVLTVKTAAVPPPSTSIALVQHAGKDAGITTSSTLGFPQSNTAGNWIAVAVRAGKMGQQFVISDSRGNVYKRAAQLDESVDMTTVALFYAENIAGGPNTVSVSDSIVDGTLRFAIAEYSGVAKSNSLDAAAVAQGTNALPQTSAITTTASGDLVIGLISTAEPAAFTAGARYTIQERVPGAPNTKLLFEDRVLANAGSTAASATLSSPDIWGALVAAFKPAP